MVLHFLGIHELIEAVRAVSVQRAVLVILLDPFKLHSTKQCDMYKVRVHDARVRKG